MKPKNVEATNSGVRAEGTWDEICQFLRNFECITEEEVEEEETVDDLNRWRPREEEENKELVEKTAEEASMEKRNMEKRSEGSKKDLKKAKKDLTNSVKETRNSESPKKDLKDASKKIARAISVKSIESLRKVEELIYEKFMINFNSCYFDTGKFSVNLKAENKGGYSTKINIPDENLREKTQEKMVGEGSR